MGKATYPNATKLLITADSGGSNSSKGRLWKKELQSFATETGLEINVCHYPPGTSKWNKIEHQLFAYISINWRGKPLRSLETIVNLIANTTTETGLEVRAMKDVNTYRKGIKVSDKEMEKINIERDEFRGKWNYKISI
jgi:predicted RNA-binding protein Jag